MPFYTCIHKDGLLDATSKQTIARGITDIHCELTGAPRHFVHVLFQAYAPGGCYTGGAPSKVANIRGAIRMGRSQETKETLLTRLTDLWRQTCPQTDLPDIVVSGRLRPSVRVLKAMSTPLAWPIGAASRSSQRYRASSSRSASN